MASATMLARSREAGSGANSDMAAAAVGGGSSGLPLVDMMLVSERVRCGYRAAMVWAIDAPIEAPTRCA